MTKSEIIDAILALSALIESDIKDETKDLAEAKIIDLLNILV